MIIVTGGAGFIGSNLVHHLNAGGRDDILVVDDMRDGMKFNNLVDARIADYMDKDEFLRLVEKNHDFGNVSAVFHQGACSVTTEWDGRYMLDNNFTYSKIILQYCLSRKIPFIYASSAAVYGAGNVFIEEPRYEKPLNLYGYSKMLFDQYVRRLAPLIQSQVAGLRYFNVYGPREAHKGSMASVAYHLNNQIKETGIVRLFAGCDGYADGEQCRDFIHVDDIVKLNLWFWEHPHVSGIFNAGTGASQPFNDVARAVIAAHKGGAIEYIPFPEHLKGHYQNFTQADLTKLRAVRYDGTFLSVEDGVIRYLKWLNVSVDRETC